jgi:hypothetical protein
VYRYLSEDTTYEVLFRYAVSTNHCLFLLCGEYVASATFLGSLAVLAIATRLLYLRSDS